ncbi:hypothetical protein J6590_052221 [Homalodisca vitripennis]|nr:hypothetical protein J6590_052221 [Homalodisca vitripennis]
MKEGYTYDGVVFVLSEDVWEAGTLTHNRALFWSGGEAGGMSKVGDLGLEVRKGLVEAVVVRPERGQLTLDLSHVLLERVGNPGGVLQEDDHLLAELAEHLDERVSAEELRAGLDVFGALRDSEGKKRGVATTDLARLGTALWPDKRAEVTDTPAGSAPTAPSLDRGCVHHEHTYREHRTVYSDPRSRRAGTYTRTPPMIG